MSQHEVVSRALLRAALEERLSNLRVIDGVYVEKLAMLHGELSCSVQLASSREGAQCLICRRTHGGRCFASPSECVTLRHPNPRLWVPAVRPSEAGCWVPPHRVNSSRRPPRNLPTRMPRRPTAGVFPRRPPAETSNPSEALAALPTEAVVDTEDLPSSMERRLLIAAADDRLGARLEEPAS